MNRIVVSMVVLGSMVAGSLAVAQSSPLPPWQPNGANPFLVAKPAFDDAELERMLASLGYRPEGFELGHQRVFKISVTHAAQTRVHYAMIDRANKTVAIVGGAGDFNVHASKVSGGLLREMMHGFNAIAPAAVFINDKDVIVMNRTFGYEGLTQEDLGKQIELFRSNFDTVYLPILTKMKAEQTAVTFAPF